MVHRQQDVHYTITLKVRQPSNCLLTCPCKGKDIFTTYPIKHELFLRDYMCTIYQRYATQPECAYDISKQAFLNILSCSQPYKSCFHNKDILIAYQRKVQSHSQGTNYKEWYKLQTIYILEIQIIFFSFQNTKYTSKYHICREHVSKAATPITHYNQLKFSKF